MAYSSATWTAFYEKLAYLFYGIAYADGIIEAKEEEAVKSLLKEVWLDVESSVNEFGDDTAYQAVVVFDWLTEVSPDAEQALTQFEDFIKDLPRFLTPSLKALILDSANRIASAFRGRNKAELTLLVRLDQFLKAN